MIQRILPFRYALVGTALALSAMCAEMPVARAAVNTAATVYAPIKAGLQNVYIPVALPTVFPLPKMPSTTRIYADIQDNSQSATTYIVDLGYTKDCNGGGACGYGEVTGGWTGDTPGVLAPLTGGVPITLQGGVKGTFYPFKCGASCGDSVILWHHKGIPYTVGLKAGSRSNVLLMANSAVANTHSAS